ncbi:MAG TPA: hypothetical protein VMP86_08500 [Candidatus Binatia bacterium]|nr:hypothetical protein [Candidatus Binatia bacterium]
MVHLHLQRGAVSSGNSASALVSPAARPHVSGVAEDAHPRASAVELKHYAPGIGLLMEETVTGGSKGIQLIEFREGRLTNSGSEQIGKLGHELRSGPHRTEAGGA